MVVGRTVEIKALDAALGQALAGRGRLLLLEGEAGIGKTTIARVVADRASEAGAVVRWGACGEDDTMAFSVWLDVLRQPGGDACSTAAEQLERGDLDIGDDAPGAERARARFFDTVVDALREAAAVGPQLIVLEDVHWADDGSLGLLRAMAPRLPAMAALMVASYRPEEARARDLLSGLGGAAEPITLDGLGVEEVAEVLAGMLHREPTAEEASAVHDRTGGNPLFVSQVGRLLASGSGATIPTGVRHILGRRLARVSSGSDRILGVAAVLGTEFDPTVVASVVSMPDRAVLEALDEAAEARLVTHGEDVARRCSFVHDLVRSTRYEMLGGTERADLHRRVVDVLEGRGAPAGVLAHHAARARFESDDERPARFAVAAAREALTRFAWEDAEALSQRALDAAPPGPGGEVVRAEAWLVSGDARLRSRGDAAGAFTAAAAIGRRTGRPDLVARAALGFGAGLAGFEVRLLDQRQIELLEEAAATLPEDSYLRPIVLARLSVALSFVGSLERRLSLADEALALARRLADDRAIATALAARCDVIAGPRHVTERHHAASEIVTLALRTGDPGLELLGRRLRVVALLELRDLSGFDAEVSAYARTAEQLADPLYTWWVPIWRATRAHADGDIDEARRLGGRGRELGDAGGSVNADLMYLMARNFQAVDRRDDAELDHAWTEMIDRHPDLFRQKEAVTALSAYLAARTGRTEQARAELARLGPDALDRIPEDQEWLPAVSELTMAGVICGDEPVVQRGYDLLRPHAGLGVFDGAAATDHGVVDRFLTRAAAVLGDTDAAREHADAAVLGNANAGRLLVAHARAEASYALRHGTAEDRERALVLARQALDSYEALGLERLAAELRDAHVGLEGPTATPSGASLVREGDTWAVTFEGVTIRVRHAKGIADLAVLLARPHQEVHVRTLEGVDHLSLPSSTQAVSDDTALAQYRERLTDLEDEIEEAEANADIGRTERLRAEREALVDELAHAAGLGGRARPTADDPDERLRKAVSARVKASITRIEGLHPSLGRHLRNSVNTGYLCSYTPETPTTWEVAPRRSR
ncbi:MAG: ATP-binding protein [Acidimicrobiia bacterium]